MRVAIEGTPFFRTRTGIDHYTVNMVRALVSIDPETRYTVIGYRGDGAKPSPLPPAANLSYRFVNWIPRPWLDSVSKRLFVPPLDLISAVRADVMIFPNYVTTPLVWTRRSVVVIYDLGFVHHPEYVEPKNARYLQRAVRRSAARADRIVTISEHSRRQIVECYGVDESRVTVAYAGVDRTRFRPLPADVSAAVAARFGIDRPYVLFTGTVEPRKNILGLLRAFGELSADLRDRHALVIAGGRGWLDREIAAEISALSASGARVVQTGYVDDADMPALFGGATAFAFPSFYEGFGMPPLEAMACGTPVIVSDASSLPEVVGDAAEIVDPHDTASIAAALDRVLRDPALRSRLSAAGLARCARFDWEVEAAKLRELLRRL